MAGNATVSRPARSDAVEPRMVSEGLPPGPDLPAPIQTARLIARRSVVQSCTRSGRLANSMKNSSSSLPSRSYTNRSIAERAADILSGVMLPLESSTMPRLTGTRSLLNCVTSWRVPSS